MVNLRRGVCIPLIVTAVCSVLSMGGCLTLPLDPNEIGRIIPPTTQPVSANALYKDPNVSVAERVENLLSLMTLAEKVGQMLQTSKFAVEPWQVTLHGIGALCSGGGDYPEENTPQGWADMINTFQKAAMESRLGIPMIYAVDAVHGHAGVVGATVFPHNVGLGATRDAELVSRIGKTTAIEMAATGAYWDYAPTVAVAQDIRWGRACESYGENTELVTTLGTAYLRGLQGDVADPCSVRVMGTPKHFIADGATVWGSSSYEGMGFPGLDGGNSDVDEATLRSVHLPPYVSAIQEGVLSIMASYSSWNGTKMHANRYLLTDVLKGELGFDGIVVSDWAAIERITGFYFFDVVQSINAGIDMVLAPYLHQRVLVDVPVAIQLGAIKMERINDAVRRILTAKLTLGLFEHPYAREDLLPRVGSTEHREIAREAVRKSLVLLKNDGDTLPLSKETATILVAGQAANDIGIQCGGWTVGWQSGAGEITKGTTLLAGIRATVASSAGVFYDPSGEFAGSTENEAPSLPADVGVVVVGEMPYAEGMGDREDLHLSQEDVDLIKTCRDKCRKLVVVLISGRPMIITDLLEGVDAWVAAWLPGTEGRGVADVLFGDYPFTGKLPYTWPKTMDQLPLETLAGQTPLFSFGYGLSTEGRR